MKYDTYLDCKGLSCPMPIVRIGLELKQLSVGQILKADADDPAFKNDIIALIRRLGHSIIDLNEQDKIITVFIRKEEHEPTKKVSS